jgi:hypothetical protein
MNHPDSQNPEENAAANLLIICAFIIFAVIVFIEKTRVFSVG